MKNKTLKLSLFLSFCSFYLNTFGQTIKAITAEKFDKVGSIGWNIAAVSQNNKWGIINKKGEVTVPFQYDSIGVIKEYMGIANVKKNGLWGIYNLKAKNYMVSCEYKSEILYSNKSAIGISKNGKWAVYNFVNKKFITEFKYDSFDGFLDDETLGYVFAKKDNIRYAIDEKGVERVAATSEGYVHAPRPDFLSDYIEGYEDAYKISDKELWIVSKNKKFGVIDVNKKEVIALDFSTISYERGLFEVYQDKKKSFFNLEGKKLIPFCERGYLREKCGIIIYRNENKYGCNNINGEVIEPLDYDIIDMGYGGSLGFKGKGVQYEFINCSVKNISKEVYQNIKEFDELFFVKKDNIWALVEMK